MIPGLEGAPEQDGSLDAGGRPSARVRSERLYAALRERICLLDYPPGQRLSEEALAAEFGVSRTPIRRALGRLEAEGLVEIRHGAGSFVTDSEPADSGQVFALRMELAALIGRLEPLPRSAEDLARIEALIERCDRLAGEQRRPGPAGDEAAAARAFARLNMDFFDELGRMIGNRALAEVSARLYYQTSRIWLKSVPQLNLGEEIAIFRREMSEILGALQCGDLEAVGQIRRHHIAMSVQRMLRYGADEG